MGCGVSGGEDGARYGPSLMPGGAVEAWPSVKNIFQVAMHMYMPIYLHLSPSIYLSIYLSTSIYLFVYLFVCLFIYLYIYYFSLEYCC